MEFDSRLQVFAVYVGDMIIDLPNICHIAHAGLFSSVVSRFLSILVFDYKSILQRE